jgi:serine/threonine protein kinase
MTIPKGTRLGPYEIETQIGAGGMGAVYLAVDSRLERKVAIKILPSLFASSPQFLARFEREAKTISSLSHPNICVLHDVGKAELPSDQADPDAVSLSGDVTVHYLVMEYLEGESLADRVAKGPLPLHEVLRIGRQIADALDKAHRQGIVHRDLKPGNVMLTKTGAKLLDFGLAKTGGAISDVGASQATVAKPLTQEGTIVGTFQYMSPEQLEGVEADARSDIFALGCVLYEMAIDYPNFYTTDWSPDARVILGNTQRADTGMDITWIDLEDPNNAMGDLVRTRFEEVTPKFSPDGNWIAYTSDETGRNEVYVVDFPGGTTKRQASRNGGSEAAWSRKGNELYFASEDGVMAARVVISKGSIEIGAPERIGLSKAGLGAPFAGDGERFVMIKPVGGDIPNPVFVVRDWTLGLK